MNTRQNIVDRKKLKLFDDFLESFQGDLVKIISKYKGESHPLDSDELLSEINLYLIKSREKIINYIGKNFEYDSFKHTAFIYCRNLIKWKYSSLTSSEKKSGKWISKRLNNVYSTEEGEKTSLDLALDQSGVESNVENINIGNRYEYILNEIKSKLTKNELKIFLKLESGEKQKNIAKELGVTRQAIDLSYQKIIAKAKSIRDLKDGMRSKILNDDFSEKISEGNKAINDFFEPSNYFYFNNKDKSELALLLISNPLSFTGEYVSDNFFGGKFTEYQIINQSRWLKLGFLLKKKPTKQKFIFSKEDEELLINLSNKGVPGKEIAKKLKKPISSIRAKETHLYKAGLLKRTSKMKERSSNK